MAAGESVMGGGYLVGTGVLVTGIDRVYDRFLGLQLVDAAETMGEYGSMQETLSRLEEIFNDSMGLGLGDTLNEFFSALQDVANDPSDYSARTVLLGKANTLAGRINTLDSRIGQEIENIEAKMKGEVEVINSLTTRIANLNVKIGQMEINGQQANDLRDERDFLINDLAESIDVTVLETENGQMTILTSGGNLLVAGDSTTSLSATRNPDNNNYYDIMLGNYNITDSISSGKLKGLIETRDTHYQDALTRLEIIAASITREFNLIHRQGYGLDGSTGLDLFAALSPVIMPRSSNTGGTAATASIQDAASLTLDEYEIRFTGSSNFDVWNVTKGTVVSSGNAYVSGADIDFEGMRAIVTDDTGTPQSGDNANVLNMINLKDTKVLSNGGATFNSFYSSLVSDIGIASGEASINSNAQALVVDELNRYCGSVSGVSLDEEEANLLKYQHAYQAAAKVMTVVDSMLDVVMNLR